MQLPPQHVHFEANFYLGILSRRSWNVRTDSLSLIRVYIWDQRPAPTPDLPDVLNTVPSWDVPPFLKPSVLT